MRRINEIYLVVAVTCLLLAACGGGTAARWNGGMYEGDVIVDGVRPTDAKPEKFKLVTGKTKRTVSMDAGNKYLGNCEIAIDDKYSAGITDDARFAFEEKSAVCNGVTVHAGDLTLEKEKGTISATVVDPNGRSYTIKINGIQK
ncbi:MAG: hypothetical protein ABL952_12485 [Pyrinomonadaceae bacterium]